MELHKNRIIHRDLKPANILINDNIFKIADLGLCKNMEQRINLNSQDMSRHMFFTTIVGNDLYKAPEVHLEQAEKCGFKVDIFSLGLMFYELLFGHLLFTGNEMIKILSQEDHERLAYKVDLKFAD